MSPVRKLTYCVAVVLALAGWVPAGAAEPDVLKQVPADAQLVVIIPNLSALSEKATAVGKALGLDRPELNNPLEMLKGAANIGAGLNDTGGLAVVMPVIPLDGSQPNWLALVPVKDYKAFAGQLGAQGEAITGVELQGNPAFIKRSGSYAALSNQKEMLESYKPDAVLAQRAGALGAQLLGGSDAAVYVDITKIAPVFAPMVQMQFDNIKAQLGGLGPQGAQAVGMIDAYGQAIQALLRDGQSIVVGLNASPEGFGLSFAAQFKADSALAKTFAKTPVGEPAFTRLPKKPYILAASMNFGSLPMGDWYSAILGGQAGGPFASLAKATVDVLKQSNNSMQWMMLAPNLGGGGGLFNTIGVFETKEPSKFVADYRKLIEGMNGLDLGQGVSYRTEYKAGAEVIDGKNVDGFRQKMDAPPAVVGQLGAFGGFLTQETKGYVAPVSGAVVVASGSEPTALKDILAAAGGQGELGKDEHLTAIRSKLLANRVFEGYLGVGTLIQFANGFISLMAPQAVIEAPQNMPPVAIAMSTNGGGAGFALYVPMPVVTTVQKAIQKFQGGGASPSPGSSPGAAPAVESKNVVALTDDTFKKEALEASQPVLVDFWAVWAGPCKSQAPVVAELADRYQGKIKVGKIDIDKEAKTADLYQVEAVPTLLLIKDGQVVQKFVGLTAKDKLEAAILQALK